MRANELRIGNWVYYKGYGQVNFHSLDVLFIKHAKDFNPIPLTPEILEACGFIWDSDDDGNTLAESYVLNNFVWSVGLKELYYNNEPVPHIEYLHQLQNLYFALIGTELTVNLPDSVSV